MRTEEDTMNTTFFACCVASVAAFLGPVLVCSAQSLKVSGLEIGVVGALAPLHTASHFREVTNDFSGPLRLRVLSSSCPCVTVKLEPEVIPVGGTGLVTIYAPVVAVASEQFHWAKIGYEVDSAGEASRGQFDVAVRYSAKLDVLVVPQQLWITAVAGLPTERSIFLRSIAIDALNPRNFRFSESGISNLRVVRTRRFMVPTEDRPGEECLQIYLEADHDEPGLFKTTLTFDAEGTEAEHRVAIQIRVLPRIKISPAAAVFLSSHESEKSVFVERRDGGKLLASKARFDSQMSDMNSNTNGVSAKISEENGALRVLISIDRSRLPSSGWGDLVLENEEAETVAKIPVVWVFQSVTDQATGETRR
jgi:hypothetical protein